MILCIRNQFFKFFLRSSFDLLEGTSGGATEEGSHLQRGQTCNKCKVDQEVDGSVLHVMHTTENFIFKEITTFQPPFF